MKYQDEQLQKSNYAFLSWFGFDEFVPERAVTSDWVSSKVFFVIRFVLALYSFIVLWVNLGFSASDGNGDSFFAFFTNLTFIGLHAYLVTATVHHFRYLRNKNVNSFLNQPAILNYLYVFLYCTVVTYNIVTPVVYWSLLAKDLGAMSTRAMWLNASVHGASFFLMIFDVIFNRMKLPLRMIVLVLANVILYMCLAFIVYATQGYWVYPFLNWEQGPKAALWYFAVALIITVSYFLQILIHLLRDFIARKTNRSEQSSQKVEDHVSMTKIDSSIV